MLGKLLKHELKATSRFMIPLYIILFFLTVLNKFMLSLDVYHGVLSFISGIIMLLYVLFIVAVGVLTFVILIARFYKNLITDEGYLTFTLPVKVSQIINTKLIIAMLWILISILLILVSIIVIAPGGFADLRNVFESAYEAIRSQFGNNSTLLIIEFILMMFLALIQNIVLIYVSIAVGQLFNKNRLIASFVAYIAISMASQIIIVIMLIIGAHLYGASLNELSAVPNIVFPASIIITILFNFVYYYGTIYIFNNKLNLE